MLILSSFSASYFPSRLFEGCSCFTSSLCRVQGVTVLLQCTLLSASLHIRYFLLRFVLAPLDSLSLPFKCGHRYSMFQSQYKDQMTQSVWQYFLKCRMPYETCIRNLIIMVSLPLQVFPRSNASFGESCGRFPSCSMNTLQGQCRWTHRTRSVGLVSLSHVSHATLSMN